jgi:hypothetical protein
MRLSLALVLPLAAVLSAPLRGAIHIESQSVSVDRSRDVARFAVRFDGVPDFWSMDEFDRLADSFQYEIAPAWNAPLGLPPESLSSVVRGDEIHVANGLRVRDAAFNFAPDDDPDAGGWGRVIATVPFTLTGRELRFEAPLAALGDDDGYFAYRLFTTEYGLTVDELESRLLPPGEDPDPDPTPIPLPPALPTAALTTLLLMVRWCRHAGGSPT